VLCKFQGNESKDQRAPERALRRAISWGLRNSPCPKEENSGETAAEAISRAWQFQNSDAFPFYGFSPIVNSTIFFRNASLAGDSERTRKQKIPTALFCPGTDIPTRKWRIKLEILNVRLQDLASAYLR
jgi:hypothetical protein